MKIDDIKVLYSPMINKIYVGTQKNDGTCSNKKDVTDSVISTIITHLHDTGAEYECEYGVLSITPYREGKSWDSGKESRK